MFFLHTLTFLYIKHETDREKNKKTHMEATVGSDAGEGGTKTSKGKMEAAGTTTIESIPDEILLIVLSLLFGKTLMIIVPQVCKRWRKLCPEIKNVHLDFGWWIWKVPVEVLAGWRLQLEMPLIAGGGGGGSAAAAAAEEVGQQGEGRWASGMCEVFPRTTSVTMGRRHAVGGAHVMSLAGKCADLKHTDFEGCISMTDAALLALADKCRGLEHAV